MFELEKVKTLLTRIVKIISAPSEIKDFFIYTFLVVLTSGSIILTTTLKNGLISKNLGTLALDTFTITNNIITLSSYVLMFFTYGLIAQISQHLAKNEFELIGRRINTAMIFSLIMSSILVVALYFLREPLLYLYNPTPALHDMIVPYYNFFLSIVPLVMFSSINGGIMIGLRQLFLRMIMEIITVAIDFGFLLLFMFHFKLGIFSVYYAYFISRIFCEIFQFSYIYRPAFVRKFRLFTSFAWKIFDKNFLKGFMSDSGLLVGRGIVLMSQYAITPIVASRLGPNELAAYSILISLYFYPNLISDCIGTVCNIKGSQYIGQKKFSYFNRLVLFCPLAAFIISLIFISIYGFTQNKLFHLFSDDPNVIEQIDNSFIYWLFTILLASVPGTFEGLVMSKQYFGLMFIVMVASMSMWIPITCLNIIWLQELPLVFVAMMVFMWTRFLPLVLIIYWEYYYVERNWEDGVVTLVEEEKLEISPLVVN